MEASMNTLQKDTQLMYSKNPKHDTPIKLSITNVTLLRKFYKSLDGPLNVLQNIQTKPLDSKISFFFLEF